MPGFKIRIGVTDKGDALIGNAACVEAREADHLSETVVIWPSQLKHRATYRQVDDQRKTTWRIATVRVARQLDPGGFRPFPKADHRWSRRKRSLWLPGVK